MLYSYFPFAAALLLAAPLTASAAEAESSTPDKAGLFTQIDANGDGQLSEEETPQDKRRLFARLLRRGDANGDGKLSREEFAKALKDERPETQNERPGQPGGDQFRQFLQADSQEVFKRLDANGDGKIELSETPEQGRERLERFLEYYDANRDKSLTFDEFRKGHEMLRSQAGISQPARPPMPGGLLKVLDANGDGMLSKEEISSAAESLRKLDRDGDGAINPRELMAVLPPPPGEKRPNGAQRPDGARLLERLRSLDSNGDGKWSESELPPFLRPRFAKIDLNSDGFVDAEELRQGLKSQQGRQPKDRGGRASRAASK